MVSESPSNSKKIPPKVGTCLVEFEFHLFHHNQPENWRQNKTNQFSIYVYVAFLKQCNGTFSDCSPM